MADATLTDHGQDLEADALLRSVRGQLVAQFRVMHPRSQARQRLGEIIYEIDSTLKRDGVRFGDAS